MKLKEMLIYSFVFSNLIIILSFIFPIVPCSEYPNVPNPTSVVNMRTLGYISNCESNSIVEYLGYTQSISVAYFSILIVSFSVFMLILLLINKQINKHTKSNK